MSEIIYSIISTCVARFWPTDASKSCQLEDCASVGWCHHTFLLGKGRRIRLSSPVLALTNVVTAHRTSNFCFTLTFDVFI